jgi:hypothetical protein
MNDKKFVVTKDEAIANKMIAYKFKLVSAIAGTYTFVNETPDKFSFDMFDVKKLHFTNNLHL